MPLQGLRTCNSKYNLKSMVKFNMSKLPVPKPPAPKPKPAPAPPTTPTPKKPESIQSKMPEHPQLMEPPPRYTPSQSEVSKATRDHVHTAQPNSKNSSWKQDIISAGPQYISAAATTGVKAAGFIQVSGMVNDFTHSLSGGFSQVGETIEDAAHRLQNGAHNIGSFVAQPLQTGISAAVVIGGIVLAYEAYRFFR